MTMMRAEVPPFHAMAMSARASELEHSGRRVLHLEVGQPSSAAPHGVRESAARLLLEDPIGYTDSAGVYPLRRRIGELYGAWYGVDVPPTAIMIVSGASAGFTLAFLAAFGPSARVGVVEPGYPCYRNALLALGMVPVAIPTDATTRWAPTPEMIDPTLDGLIIASPSNPTGTVCDLAPIVAHCEQHGIRLISDEIYHGITYGEPAQTALQFTNSAIVVNSFSKYFSMTGWRLGWMVVPDDLTDRVERLQQNLYICAPSLSQRAAVAAFDCHEELQTHVVRYAANRALMLDGLAAAGLSNIAQADGAFYVYADVSHLTTDSMDLCGRWLDELGISVTPGIDFDTQRGHRFVRFSYSGRTEDLIEACDLLGRWRP
jgi:aspartate/methionine/tyrosine aminotransferase